MHNGNHDSVLSGPLLRSCTVNEIQSGCLSSGLHTCYISHFLPFSFTMDDCVNNKQQYTCITLIATECYCYIMGKFHGCKILEKMTSIATWYVHAYSLDFPYQNFVRCYFDLSTSSALTADVFTTEMGIAYNLSICCFF